jgi:hypothetical protein
MGHELSSIARSDKECQTMNCEIVTKHSLFDSTALVPSGLDISPELDADDYFQSVIGILGPVELGRVDITTEVSMLSSPPCLAREDTSLVPSMFCLFGKRHNARMVLIRLQLLINCDPDS